MFNLFKQPEECFICCSIDGKTDSEKTFELTYNQKGMNYPLIKLSNAYDCKCNLYAHNRCLFGINKCPTCRKITKPNLYVITNYDYFIPFVLNWVKKDNSRIEKMKYFAGIYLIFMCFILYLFDKNKEFIDTIIPPKSNISLYFSIIMGCTYFLSLYSFILEDYFRKYWLYVAKTKKCYVFM